jgi:glycosyltransferase involved in cell wall biosynthesis
VNPGVTLVTTVLNEAEQLPELLASIERQTMKPTEVIVVDGGSSDGTINVLRSWETRLPLVILSAPGANISQGRNIAIDRAMTPIIAVTDAGVTLDRSWLERIVAPFHESESPVDLASGFFHPDARSGFERALAAATLPDAGEIDPETFLPSSRSVAFRRSWFEAGVRYPEWLDYCEDVVFDLRMKRAGARFVFKPDAFVRFRPRTTLRAFWNQYYLYARGDGRAGLFWKRHLIRYATYFALIPSIIVFRNPWLRVIVALGGLAYMRLPVRRLLVRHPDRRDEIPRLTIQAALIRFVGDVAKMIGYPAGLIWRARRYGLRRDWRSISDQ